MHAPFHSSRVKIAVGFGKIVIHLSVVLWQNSLSWHERHVHKRILFLFVLCFVERWRSCVTPTVNAEFRIFALISFQTAGLRQSVFINVHSLKHKEHLINRPLKFQFYNASLLQLRNKHSHRWHFHRYVFCFSVTSITEVCSSPRTVRSHFMRAFVSEDLV
jgi:hypothetical protein